METVVGVPGNLMRGEEAAGKSRRVQDRPFHPKPDTGDFPP